MLGLPNKTSFAKHIIILVKLGIPNLRYELGIPNLTIEINDLF
jgi:hypothetical protein